MQWVRWLAIIISMAKSLKVINVLKLHCKKRVKRVSWVKTFWAVIFRLNYSHTMVMAHTFVAKKPPCWKVWKAKKVSRVLNRHFLHRSVCMVNRLRLTTPKHSHQCPLLFAMARKHLPKKVLKKQVVQNYSVFQGMLNVLVTMKFRWVRHLPNY